MPSQSLIDERNKLSIRIREARENAHLSQKELGDFLNVSDKTISSYEKSRSLPPIEKLRKIASATKQPLTFFTEDNAEDRVQIKIYSTLNAIEKELKTIRELLEKTA